MQIYNIDQLLPFVRQKPEFVILKKDGYQVIDYVYQDQHTFDIPELMECRGIKFCPDGLILARPFRKFFNYGERGADLPVHRPHYITKKMDGSMIHPVVIDNKLYLHTRKGHTDVAKKAEHFMMSMPRWRYAELCVTAVKAGWTPIFEYVGPNNRIVLRYENERLVLLAMRKMISGELMERVTLREWAAEYNLPIVPLFSSHPLLGGGSRLLQGKVQEFIAHTRALQDAEGYVIYFDDGYMVKIKAEDYVLKHRALDDLGSKKKVVALCAQGFMDDVLPILSEADADELMVFNDAFQQEIGLEMNRVHNLVSVYRAMDPDILGGESGKRKWFALWMARIEALAHLRSAAFAAIDGKDARLMLINHFIRNHDIVKTKWRGE